MKVSVITAVYNARETIADAIESVLYQVGADVEVIVIDGGSTDGTLDVLERYAGRLAVLASEPDDGIYDALNKGIALASGDVVGFLHADDVLEDGATLSRIAAAFDDPTVDAVYGDLVYVRHADIGHVVRYWRAGQFSRGRLRWGWMPPHPTLYVRRGVYERLGSFNTDYRIAADYDWMLRFLGNSRRPNVAYIPAVLVKMRVGGVSNRSVKNIVRKSREDYRALKRNGVGGIGALVWKNFSKVPQFFVRCLEASR